MEKTSHSLLIIFYKNPVKGKVKTRLATTLGDDKALAIFKALATHTHEVTQNIPFDKKVFYSDHIESDDLWASCQKGLQHGSDLGERMANAFHTGFRQGYSSICIIGTDCYELSEGIIMDAFEALSQYDAVIGPARDGGYYLIGMKTPLELVFKDKQWSTESVFRDTVEDFIAAGWRYETLPLLRDVDREEDVPEKLRRES